MTGVSEKNELSHKYASIYSDNKFPLAFSIKRIGEFIDAAKTHWLSGVKCTSVTDSPIKIQNLHKNHLIFLKIFCEKLILCEK